MSVSWRFTARDNAFITSGRFSVTHATPAFSSTRISAMLWWLSASALLGAAARARLLAEVRLQILRRQLVADERRGAARGFDELVEIDAGLHAHRVEHRDDVLGREVARRTRRVRTAAEPTGGRVDRRDAELHRGHAVRERGALRIVEVDRERADRMLRDHEAEHFLDLGRIRDADRVADRDLEHAHVGEPAGQVDDALRIDLAFVRTPERGRQVRAHLQSSRALRTDDLLERGERLR